MIRIIIHAEAIARTILPESTILSKDTQLCDCQNRSATQYLDPVPRPSNTEDEHEVSRKLNYEIAFKAWMGT